MIGIRDIKKLLSVVILTFCAVCVCSVFVNFRYDLIANADLVTNPNLQVLYDAQITMSGVVIACAGGVLGAVTLIILLFSIQRFITENSANMGVLKALGYSGNKIALDYYKFGLSVLVGSGLGYLGGFLLSPLIYKGMSSDLVRNLQFGFHIETILFVIIIPTLLFTTLSVLFAMLKLRKSPLNLIRGYSKEKVNSIVKKQQQKNCNIPFIKDMRRNALCNNLLIIFFVGFAAFGFSAQIQMAFSMRKLTPDYTMTVMLLVIGFILGAVTMLLAFSFLFRANEKYLVLLKAYGYTEKECSNALFGGYRIVSYVGFLIGTFYQFILLKMAVKLFAGIYELPEIKFSIVGFVITLIVFLALYELLMYMYRRSISKSTLGKIMNA